MTKSQSPTFQALSNSMAEAVALVSPAVITVDARRRFPASGIAVSTTHILTSDHVVERDEDILIVFPDGERVGAAVAGHDPASDLALLYIDQARLSPAQFSGSDPRVGEIALALGRPSSDGIQASLGIVSAYAGPLRAAHGGLLDRYLRTDAIPYPGFSGGPLVNAAGQVIGINTSGLVRGTSVVIPNVHALKVVEMLKSHGRVPRGYLGIRSQLVSIPHAQQQTLSRSQASGLLLVGVEDDSPASQVGLLVGDILVGLAGQTLADPHDLFAALAGLDVGSEATVEILRGGQRQFISVIIGDRK